MGREDPLEKAVATHSVFLPGKSHRGRSLAGYSPWGHKESDTTERIHFHIQERSKSQISKTRGERGDIATLKKYNSHSV